MEWTITSKAESKTEFDNSVIEPIEASAWKQGIDLRGVFYIDKEDSTLLKMRGRFAVREIVKIKDVLNNFKLVIIDRNRV